MKRTRTVLALFIALLLLCPTITAFASQYDVSYTMEASASVVGSGDEFTVTISIAENAGLKTARAFLYFDPEQISFVKYDTANGVYEPLIINAKGNDTYIITIQNPLSALDPNAKVYTETGEVVTFTFKVAETYEGPIDLALTINSNDVIKPDGTVGYAVSGDEITLKAIDFSTHEHTNPDEWESDGENHWKVCTECGRINELEEHTPGDPASCTEDQVCTVCGEVLEEAKGHTPGDPASCTEDQVCPVCGEVLEKAKGHTPGDPASCTEDQVCTVCGEVLEKAKGHTPGDPATCTEDQVCTVCGAVLEEAKGHTPGDPATCTEDQVCTVCGEVLEEAKGHTPGDAATCTEPQVCTVCGEELAPALGHDYVDGICTRCGAEDPDYNFRMLGDVNNDGVVDAEDYMLLKRYCLGTFELSEDDLKAADINQDGEVNAEDYMLLKRVVLGTYSLEDQTED